MKSWRGQQGVTLIELLVTVVILGFAVALMSGAFNQIAQMLRISSDHNNAFLGRWTQSRALYDVVSNLAIDPALAKPFVGQPEQMDLVSSALPNAQPGLARPARLYLKRSRLADDEGTATELWIEAKDAQGTSAPLRLASFSGGVEFVFVDHAGREFAQWPPNGVAQYRALPSSVLLKESASGRMLVRAATFEGPMDPPGNNAIAKAFGVGS